MDFENGRITGFKLRFKSIDDDTERYMFALVDLADAGKIEMVPGVPLYNSHYGPGYDWIMESYFERGLFDQLEAHFTPAGEVSFTPMSESETGYLNRMIELGEGARVRRIWRAHVSLMKPHYWFFIHERDKGYAFDPKLTHSTEAEQRAGYDELVGRIPELKATMLTVMAEYRDVLVSLGAADTDLARVDAEIAAIEAETRPRPAGKTDNRAMTAEVFWELIDHGLGDQALGERLDSLPDRLALFKPAAIRKFDRLLRDQDAAAYRTDIWSLAALLQGGCSDDSFEAFRGWLILQGRAVFEATLAVPDDFDVTRHHGAAGGMDALRDAAPIAFELREGKPMKPVKTPPLTLTGPEIDDDAAHLPQVAAAVAAGQ